MRKGREGGMKQHMNICVHTHPPILTLQWPSAPIPAAVPSAPWQKSPEEIWVVPPLAPGSVRQRSKRGREGRRVVQKKDCRKEEEGGW